MSYCLGFPEFKQLDLHPQRQRRILGALQKMHATGAVVTEKGGRKEKESGRERTRKGVYHLFVAIWILSHWNIRNSVGAKDWE